MMKFLVFQRFLFFYKLLDFSALFTVNSIFINTELASKEKSLFLTSIFSRVSAVRKSWKIQSGKLGKVYYAHA